MKNIHGTGINLHGHGKGCSMWKYEKKIQFPVSIIKKNTKIAKYISTQAGGANS